MSLRVPPEFVLAETRDEIIEFVLDLAQVKWPLGTTINSWWRSPTYNASLRGASPVSQHLLGLAFDLQVGPEHRERIIEQVERLGRFAFPTGFSGGAVHVQARPSRLPQTAAEVEALGLRV